MLHGCILDLQTLLVGGYLDVLHIPRYVAPFVANQFRRTHMVLGAQDDGPYFVMVLRVVSYCLVADPWVVVNITDHVWSYVQVVRPHLPFFLDIRLVLVQLEVIH